MKRFNLFVCLFLMIFVSATPAVELDTLDTQVVPTRFMTPTILRAPIAWTRATGQGVTIGVLGDMTEHDSSLVRLVAPDVTIQKIPVDTSFSVIGDDRDLAVWLVENGIALVALLDPFEFAEDLMLSTIKTLIANGISVFVNGDLSEDAQQILSIESHGAAGAVTVGRLDLDTKIIFKKIDDFIPDLFVPVIYRPDGYSHDNQRAALIASGVAAMVLQMNPTYSPDELKTHLLQYAIERYQITDPVTGLWDRGRVNTDPVTGEFSEEEFDGTSPIYFNFLDAANAVGVEIRHCWAVNSMNTAKCWETATGSGVNVAVIDMGFHMNNPEFKDQIIDRFDFSGTGNDDPNMHGTDMCRNIVAVAPDVEFTLIKCWDPDTEICAGQIAEGIDYAIQQNADIISMSWAEWFGAFDVITKKIDEAAELGIAVIWFWYKGSKDNVIRPGANVYHFNNHIGVLNHYFMSYQKRPTERQTGLSFSSPLVAGAAALMLEKNPELTPAEILEKMVASAHDLGDGCTQLDACLALEQVPTGVEYENTTPEAFFLGQNYPNPFNPSTIIPYSLTDASQITLDIYNVQGKRIRSLVQGFQQAGNYQVRWDSQNEAGLPVADGIYFYTLSVSESNKHYKITRKMILIK